MKNLEIGKRIRTLRTEKGLSREAFCGDEKELTVRQLGRIETGNNLPSLAKLDYIAGVLEIPISQLIDEGMIIVPKEYLKLKTKLIRQSIHGDEEKIRQREAIFEDIQEHFYDQLPEDEQIAVEVLQAIDDVYVSENSEFGEGLIEEYFEQLLLKTNYDTNDLLILHLYFLKCTLNAKPIDNVFENIYANILEQTNFSDANNIHLIQRVIVSIVLYHFNIEYYDLMPQTLSAVREIIDEIQDFALLPTVDFFEAKYYIHTNANKNLALGYYDKAINKTIDYNVTNVPQGSLVMFGAGFASGLLGIGSGAFKVVALDTYMKLPIKVSTATSNFMMGVTATASALIYFFNGTINPAVAAPIAIGTLIGSRTGAKVMQRLDAKYIRYIFLPILLFTIINMFLKGLGVL